MLATFLVMQGISQADEVRKFSLDPPDNPVIFGWSAAVHDDYAVISDPGARIQAGAAYVVDLNNGQVIRTLTPTIQRNDDLFGFDLDVSGNRVVVGVPANPFVRNPLPGAVNVFDIDTGAVLSRLVPNDSMGGDEFGFATSLDESLLAVGAPALGESPGRAYVFDVETGNQMFKLQPNDSFVGNEFGWDLDASQDYVVVGAPGTYDIDDPTINVGAAYVFDPSNGQQLRKLMPNSIVSGSEFGFSIGISGNKAIIGSPEGAASTKGAAYIFDLSTGQQLHKLRPSDSKVDDDFGSSVDIFGNVAVVGARGQGTVSGAVYLFDVATGVELAKLTPSDLENKDKFGSSVALSNRHLIVGSPQDVDANLNLITGSAYLFDADFGIIGDFDQDGLLTAADIDILTSAVKAGTNIGEFDLNSDGLVNQVDRTIWVEQIANTFFGDSNFDGEFGSGDLVRVFVEAEYEDGIDGNSTWADGDWNGDCEFDSGDLVFVFQRAEYETGQRNAHAVPEPSGLILLVLGGTMLLWRRGE
jgi:hypothetical protein